ncbi:MULTISPECIES: hypothetical protein [Burkholderia]|uniref:hypothetical protein n=1 Tax=Burkholderia TaxID=32008 RepID=UPI000B2E82AA|nr:MULTISPECIES: hypothetical protein [Burkholderia]MBJ9731111.1 hypothetical protein [Burkholderia cenocepacia]
MSKPMVIDFGALQGPVFTGRPRGEQLRRELHVDDMDRADAVVEVNIPESTYSISSSFILGLFGRSVVRLGSREAFYDKYHFNASTLFRDVVDACVARALQKKSLFDEAN